MITINNKAFEKSLKYKVTLKDRVAVKLANTCLQFASPFYRSMINGAINYGLSSAKRDREQGIDPPDPWLK